MPLTADSLDRDLGAMLADFPQSATIRRRGRPAYTVPCAATEAGGGGSAKSQSGMEFDDSVTVSVREADCAYPPEHGDEVTLEGSPRALSVVSVRRVPGDPCLELILEAL